jgi:hypothetical protein
LESLLAIRRERKTVNHRNQWVIIFLHEEFENLEIYCVEKYCKVTKEGPEDALFIYEAEVQAGGPDELETVEEPEVPTTPANGYDIDLAVTEVNAYLARRYFFKEEENFMEFRKKLAYAMLYKTLNEGLGVVSSATAKKRNQPKVHELVRAPKNAKFEDGEWRTSYKRKYQQHVCASIGCKNRMRTVCICNRARWMCTKCFADHCIASGNRYIEEP